MRILAVLALAASSFIYLYGSPLVKLAVIGAIVWLAFMLLITMSDYASRGWLGGGSPRAFQLEDL